MSKKKAGKARGKSGKGARRPGAVELTEDQLDQVAGGASLAGTTGGTADKDGHKEQIELVSWSMGASPPSSGGLKSR